MLARRAARAAASRASRAASATSSSAASSASSVDAVDRRARARRASSASSSSATPSIAPRDAVSIERWSAELMEDDEEIDLLLAAAADAVERAPRPGPKLRPLSMAATAFGDVKDRIFETTDERRAKIKLALQSLHARRRQLRRAGGARGARARGGRG